MEKAKRYFTQRELEKHINARLIRERKKKTELEALKNMVDTLIGEGRINANSYAEAAEKLMAMIVGEAAGNKETEKREEYTAADTIKPFNDTDATTSSEHNFNSEDEVSAKGKRVSDISFDDEKINANSYAEAAEKLMTMTAGEAAGNKEEEKTEIEKNDAAKLETVSDENIADTEGTAPKSEDIRKRRVQTANDAETDAADCKTADAGDAVSENAEIGTYSSTRLIELFHELLENLENRTKENTKDDNGFFARRDICSTGFSKTGSSEDMSLAQTLTPMQREIARRAGLSYREYAELLREIPENARKRRQMR